MTFAAKEAWEVGLFEAPFQWKNPYLFVAFWVVFLIGVGIQLLLLHKGKRRGAHWVFPVLMLIGLVSAEVGVQVITGWDMLLWLFLWFGCLTLLVSSVVAALIWKLRRK